MRGVDINGSEVLANRLHRGLTQDQLASLSQLDVKTVRKAEQGKRLDLETVACLAAALQVEIPALLTGEDFEAAEQRGWRNLVLAWLRLFDEHASEAIMEIYAEDAVLRIAGGADVPFGGVSRGKAEILRAHQASWSAGKHVPHCPAEMKIFVSKTGVTLDAEKKMYLPSGKLLAIPVIQVFTFRDGLIADHHVQFDTLEFAKQLRATS